jgi:Helix-turn-helix domain
MTVITMSRSEIDRMSVLRDLAEDRIRVSEAARLMGLGRRQVLRLAKAYRQRGPAALVSKRRGKRSNRSYPIGLRAEVIGLIRERYTHRPHPRCEDMSVGTVIVAHQISRR